MNVFISMDRMQNTFFFCLKFKASTVKTNLPNAQKDSEAQLVTFPIDRKLHQNLVCMCALGNVSPVLQQSDFHYFVA